MLDEFLNGPAQQEKKRFIPVYQVGIVSKMQTTENHHPDKKNKPKETVPIPRREHQKIHGTEPHNTPLSRTMREYDKVNTILVTMKNWSTAYQKDFDKTPEIGLEQAILLKKTLSKELKVLMKDELPKVKHIKGFGVISLAGILAYAHPNRFPSKRKFLFYCGYTQASRKLKRYSRRIKPIMHELSKETIIYKDAKYYPLYIKFKEDLSKRYPERSKKAIDVIARNRIATYLLKEIYELFRVENREVSIILQLPVTEGLSLHSTLGLQI